MGKKNDMQESNAITIFDKKGNIRSKEDFLEEVGAFYDELVHEAEEECECFDLSECSILDGISGLENQVDIAAVLDTHDFYSRTIFLADEITPKMGTEVVRKIRLWNFADMADGVPVKERLPIKLYINTEGGDIYATFNIISAIKLSTTPVYTITYGFGYSGGFFIGITGHKRFCYPYSSFLFHEGMAIDGGDAHKFLQHVDFYRKEQLKNIKAITLACTKITPKEYSEHKKDDWFFNAQQAKEYGIVDEILTSMDNPLREDKEGKEEDE